MEQQPQADWFHINAYGMPFDEEEIYSINDLVENDIYAVLRGSTFFGLDNDDNLVYGQFLPNIGITFLVFDKTNEMAPLNYSGNALPQDGSKDTYYGTASDLGYEESPSYLMVIEAQKTKFLPKKPEILYDEIQASIRKIFNDPSEVGVAIREIINTDPEYLHIQLQNGYNDPPPDIDIDIYKQIESYHHS
jgi:hypothetical protein